MCERTAVVATPRPARDGESATLERRVRVPASPPAPSGAARITSPYPTGAWAVQQRKSIEIGSRGPAGGQAAVLLPDGRRIPLIEQGVVMEAVVGDEFRPTVEPTARSATTSRYAALVPVPTPLVARDTSVTKPRIGTLIPHTPDSTVARSTRGGVARAGGGQ